MRETKRQHYEVVVITSDGEALEDEVVEAQTKRDAAGKVFGRMNCNGVETIVVSNPHDSMIVRSTSSMDGH